MSAPLSAPDEISIEDAEEISFGGAAGARAGYEKRLRELSTTAGIDPDLAVRQFDQESAFDPRAVSAAGARGIAQFMPATGKAYGLDTDDDFFDPEKSMNAYVGFMGDLKKQYGGNQAAMLAHYNGGTRAGRNALEGRLDDLPPETRDYLQRLLPPPAEAPAAAQQATAAPSRPSVLQPQAPRNEGGPEFVSIGEISIEEAEATPDVSQFTQGAKGALIEAENTVANLVSVVAHGLDLENTWKGLSRAVGDAPFGSEEWSKRVDTYRKSLIAPPTEQQVLDLPDPKRAQDLDASLAQELEGTEVGAVLGNLVRAHLGPNPGGFARAWQNLERSLRAHVDVERKKIPPTPPGLVSHIERGVGAFAIELPQFIAALSSGGSIGAMMLGAVQKMDLGGAEALKAAMLNLFFAKTGPLVAGLPIAQRVGVLGAGGAGIAAAEGAGVEDITTAGLIGMGLGLPGGRPSAKRVAENEVRSRVLDPEVLPPEGTSASTALETVKGKQPETIDVTPIRDQLKTGELPKQLGPGKPLELPPGEVPKQLGPGEQPAKPLKPPEGGKSEGAGTALDQPVKYPPAKEPAYGMRGRDTAVLIPASGTESMQRFPAHYALVEADQVVTSHRADSLQPRRDYPAGVQERTYHIAGSAEQVKIARNLTRFDPAFIYTDNPTAEHGPTITARNIAIGGNSRAIVQLQVYNGQSQAMTGQQLKEHVVGAAERFGLSKEAADGMDRPTIIRELDEIPLTHRELSTLARDLNKTFTLAVDPGARGVSNGRSMTPGTLEAISAILDTSPKDMPTVREAFRGNRSVVEALERDGIIDVTNKPAYVDGDTGTLNAAGLQLVEDAFIGRVVGNPDTLANMMPAMRNRVLRISPSILRVERTAPELEFPLILEEALRHEHKRQSAPGKRLTIEQYLAPRKQTDLEVQLPPSAPAAQVLRALGIKNNEQVRILFDQFARDVATVKSNQSDLFVKGPVSLQEAFEAAFGHFEGPQFARFSVELAEGEIPLGPAESWPNPAPELIWPDGAQVAAEARRSANEFNEKLHGVQAAKIKIDPGPNWVGHIEPPLPFNQKPVKRPVQPSEVVFGLLDAFGHPLKTGNLRGVFDPSSGTFMRPPSNMAGFFQPFFRVMRSKKHHDLHTDVHEFGHLLEDLNPRLVRALWNPQEAARGQQILNAHQGWPKTHDSAYLDLIGVSYDRAKIQEGWAEGVRLWFTDKKYTEAKAPTFFKWFEETFLPSLSKREQKAMRRAQELSHKYISQGPLNQLEAMIGPRRNPGKAEVSISRSEWFRQLHMNKAYGFLRAERRVSGQEHVIDGVYEAAIRLAREPSIRRVVLERGQLVRDRTRGIDAVRIEGPSIAGALSKVVTRSSDDLRLFRLYAVGRATAETAAQGRESLTTPSMRVAAKMTETPEFIAAYDELKTAMNFAKEFGISAGLFSRDAANQWRRSEFAFSLLREPTPGYLKNLQNDPSRAMSSYNPIRRYSGGSEALREPLEMMVESPVRIYMAGLDNLLRLRVMDDLIQTENGGLVGRRIPSEHKKVSIHREWFASQVAREIRESGDPWLAKYVKQLLQSGASGEAFVELWMPFQRPVGDDVMVVLRNGRPEYAEITDPILANALANLRGGYKIHNGLMTALDNIRRFRQSAVTLWPGFIAKNIARDQQTVWISAEIPYNPFTDFARGLRHSVMESPEYWDMLANGGGNSTLRSNTTVIRDSTHAYLRRNGISPRNWVHNAADVVRTLDWIGRKTEEATRMGLALRSQELGDSVTRSAFLQGQASADFRVRGSSLASEVGARTIPFMHAMVASIDRVIFRIEQPSARRAILQKSALLAVAAGALAVYNSEGEDAAEYNELRDFERDGAYHWYPFGVHVQMAKAYDYGVLPMLAERTFIALANGLWDGEWKAPGLGRAVVRTFATTFGIGLPVVGDEIAEQALNRDFFTGETIVPHYLLGAEPFAQTKAGTPEILNRTAKALFGATGGRLSFSPARVHHIATTLLGHFGQIGLALADATAFGYGAAPAWQDYFFSIAKPPGGSNRATVEYYAMMDELSSLQASISSMRQARQRGDSTSDDTGILRDLQSRPEAALLGPSRDWADSVASFNRQIHDARKDPKLSLSERRDETQRIEKKRNLFMRKLVTKYEGRTGHPPR